MSFIFYSCDLIEYGCGIKYLLKIRNLQYFGPQERFCNEFFKKQISQLNLSYTYIIFYIHLVECWRNGKSNGGTPFEYDSIWRDRRRDDKIIKTTLITTKSAEAVSILRQLILTIFPLIKWEIFIRRTNIRPKIPGEIRQLDEHSS